jgi:hypothetical protein
MVTQLLRWKLIKKLKKTSHYRSRFGMTSDEVGEIHQSSSLLSWRILKKYKDLPKIQNYWSFWIRILLSFYGCRKVEIITKSFKDEPGRIGHGWKSRIYISPSDKTLVEQKLFFILPKILDFLEEYKIRDLQTSTISSCRFH